MCLFIFTGVHCFLLFNKVEICVSSGPRPRTRIGEKEKKLYWLIAYSYILVWIRVSMYSETMCMAYMTWLREI